MKVALLFLIKEQITHLSAFEKHLETCNFYIHAKDPTRLPRHLQTHLIPTIPTEWCGISIVNATLLLLQTACKCKENQWFILLSGEDSYPLVTAQEMLRQLANKDLSMFFSTPQKHAQLTTHSQWFAINRVDADTIIFHASSFMKSYLKRGFNPVTNSCPDENFFLSLLKEKIKNYKHENRSPMMTIRPGPPKSDIYILHPAIINSLLSTEPISHGSLFIRKVSPLFRRQPTQTETINIHTHTVRDRPLYIVIHGTESPTNTSSYMLSTDSIRAVDIVVLSLIDVSQVNPVLLRSAKYIFPIVYKNAQEVSTVLRDIYALRGYRVNIISEREALSPLINSSLSLLPSLPKKRKKIALLFLTRGDLNHPHIWTRYLRGCNERVNVYCHPKEAQRVKTLWLKRAILSDEKRVETGWGFIVAAYLQLMRTAMEDPDNEKFLIISESCLPLHSFGALYSHIIERDDPRVSYFRQMPIKKYDLEERIRTQLGYSRFSFVKHYARFCLSRYHVLQLLAKPQEDLDFFTRMHVGDEFFLSLLRPRVGTDFFVDLEITRDNWTAVETLKRDYNLQIEKLFIKKEQNTKPLRDRDLDAEIAELRAQRDEISKNPYSYMHVSRSNLQEALDSPSFFWRKFPAESDVAKLYM